MNGSKCYHGRQVIDKEVMLGAAVFAETVNQTKQSIKQKNQSYKQNKKQANYHGRQVIDKEVMLGAAAFTVSRERMQVLISILMLMLIIKFNFLPHMLMLLLGCELHRPN